MKLKISTQSGTVHYSGTGTFMSAPMISTQTGTVHSSGTGTFTMISTQTGTVHSSGTGTFTSAPMISTQSGTVHYSGTGTFTSAPTFTDMGLGMGTGIWTTSAMFGTGTTSSLRNRTTPWSVTNFRNFCAPWNEDIPCVLFHERHLLESKLHELSSNPSKQPSTMLWPTHGMLSQHVFLTSSRPACLLCFKNNEAATANDMEHTFKDKKILLLLALCSMSFAVAASLFLKQSKQAGGNWRRSGTHVVKAFHALAIALLMAVLMGCC
ncbi:hypothetical protein Tco_0360921 [Tanacetum coccineum]